MIGGAAAGAGVGAVGGLGVGDVITVPAGTATGATVGALGGSAVGAGLGFAPGFSKGYGEGYGPGAAVGGGYGAGLDKTWLGKKINSISVSFVDKNYVYRRGHRGSVGAVPGFGVRVSEADFTVVGSAFSR